jgi:Tubulin C-terminal domain
LFEPANFLADVSAPNYLKNNRYLAASVLLRGVGETGDALQAGEAVQAVHSLSGSSPKSRIYKAPSARFVPWLPNGYKVGIVGVPPYVPKDFPMGQMDRQGVLLANTTAVRSLFLRQYQKFLKLFFHKSFIWQFLEAGGELDLFYEAKESVQEILQRYKKVLDSCASAESDAQIAVL